MEWLFSADLPVLEQDPPIKCQLKLFWRCWLYDWQHCHRKKTYDYVDNSQRPNTKVRLFVSLALWSCTPFQPCWHVEILANQNRDILAAFSSNRLRKVKTEKIRKHMAAIPWTVDLWCEEFLFVLIVRLDLGAKLYIVVDFYHGPLYGGKLMLIPGIKYW